MTDAIVIYLVWVFLYPAGSWSACGQTRGFVQVEHEQCLQIMRQPLPLERLA